MVLGIGTRARREKSTVEVPLNDFSEGRANPGAESYHDTVRYVKNRVRGLKLSARQVRNVVRFELEGNADQITAARKLFGLDG